MLEQFSDVTNNNLTEAQFSISYHRPDQTETGAFQLLENIPLDIATNQSLSREVTGPSA
jgi:hypothetical protein